MDPANLIPTLQSLQQSIASSIDVAYLLGDVTGDPARLSTTTRGYAGRALAPQPAARPLDGAGQPHATPASQGRLTLARRPLPSDARDEVGQLVATAVAASGRAASISLQSEQTQALSGPSQRRRRTRPKGVPMPNRSARTPAPPSR